MMSIFGDIERLAADLYPYRWPIGIAALIALGAIVVIGYRRDWHGVVRRHPRASVAVAVVALAIVIPLGNELLSPLWTRTELNEASPLEAAAAGAEGAAVWAAASSDGGAAALPADGSFAPRVTRTGEFHGADSLHRGSGRVQVIETAPGGYTLRFEEFSVLNGPDLYVYLSPSAEGYADGAFELGTLKATDGAFNYEVPAGVDVSQYQSVIIWCKRFSVLFATAPLVSA